MKHEPTSPTQRWCRRCGHPSSDHTRCPRAVFTAAMATGRWNRNLKYGGLRGAGGARLAWRP